MKLAYLTLEAPRSDGYGSGPSAVLVHGEGGVPVEDMVGFARSAGLDGPIVVAFGNYATTPSGMEVGGLCWYRSLPGDAGTDPLTLTRAVVQLTDLLADVADTPTGSRTPADRPVLVGWRQGATVAIGAGLLAPGSVGAVVAINVLSSHLALLPKSLVASADGPPVLVVADGEVEDADPATARAELERRGVSASVFGDRQAGSGARPQTADGGGTRAGRENGEGPADAVGDFVRRVAHRPVAEGSPP